MIDAQDVSRKARQIFVPLMGAAIMSYFAYHAVQGDRGLIAWWNLRYEIDKADATLTTVTTERQTLERRVALLRPQSLDSDMLEERAHLMLGEVQGDDLIIPDPTEKAVQGSVAARPEKPAAVLPPEKPALEAPAPEAPVSNDPIGDKLGALDQDN